MYCASKPGFGCMGCERCSDNLSGHQKSSIPPRGFKMNYTGDISQLVGQYGTILIDPPVPCLWRS